jgi:hypothetical protein
MFQDEKVHEKEEHEDGKSPEKKQDHEQEDKEDAFGDDNK